MSPRSADDRSQSRSSQTGIVIGPYPSPSLTRDPTLVSALFAETGWGFLSAAESISTSERAATSVKSVLPGSPTYPMTNQFVFRHGGRVCLENLYEPASFQRANCILHCRFRKPGPFGKLLQAQCNAFLLFAKERRPQNQIHQKSRGSTIVTGQIRQQYVNHVFVNWNMLHATIVYESIGLLPAA